MRAKPEMKPWVHTEEKYDELRRSGTHSERLVCVVAIRGLAFVEKVLLMRSLKNVWDQLTQGLRPGLCRSVALAGLFYAFTTQHLLGRPFWSVKTVLCFSYITSVSTHTHSSKCAYSRM